MKNRKYTIILCVTSALESIFISLIPILSYLLINLAVDIKNGESSLDILYVIGVLAITALMVVLARFVNNILLSRYSLKLEKEYKEYLYNNISKKKYSEITKYSTGKIEQLYHSDISNIIRRQTEIIPSFVRQITKVLLSILILSYIDYIYLIVILLAGGIGFLLAKAYSKLIKPHHKASMEADGKLNSYIIESNNQIKLIQAFNASKYANDYFNNLNDNAISIKKKRNNIIYGANSGLYAFTTIFYIATICYGAYGISKSILTYGSLIALIQLLSNVQNPMLSLSALINQYNVSSASIERINEVLNLNDNEELTNINYFESIIFDNVSFSYDNDNLVINNMSFEIRKNDIVLLSGPSGIGKTTLFMLLLGFIEPTSGQIYIKAKDGNIELSSKTRGLFGYVPQENILFSGSITDNIYILTGKKLEEAIEALKMANIYDEINQLPDGFNTKLGERGRGLSLGQIQRLLIAIALLKNSEILLLDEFSSALDSENEDIIINNISKLNKTIIYITHRNKKIDNQKVITMKE